MGYSYRSRRMLGPHMVGLVLAASGSGVMAADEVALDVDRVQQQLDALWTAAGLDQLDAALEEAGLATLRSEAPGLLAEASTRAVDLLPLPR